VLAGVVVVLVGCGAEAPGERVVTGTGYRFRAPAGWEVVRTAREVRAAEGENSAALVGVSRFHLRRAYRQALWSKVVRELDSVSGALARQQHGSVTDAKDVRISGTRARRYRVAYVVGGKKLVEELVFLLRGKTEYLLLCRYAQGASHDACDTLTSSFKLT
jgi:hypothetical protein